MQRLQSVEEAEVLFREFGWFGPPVIAVGPLLPPRPVDGRKRVEAAKRLNASGKIPGVLATSPQHAARLLALVGHYKRAAAELPDFDWTMAPDEIATILGLPRAVAATLKQAATGKRPGRRTDLEQPEGKHRWRRRADCVERVRALYRRSLGSPEPITSDQLREALGEWA